MSALLRFSIPLLIGTAQQMAARGFIIVGRYVGDKALSAIGHDSSILNLLLVLFMAVSTAGIMAAHTGPRIMNRFRTNWCDHLTLSLRFDHIIGIP